MRSVTKVVVLIVVLAVLGVIGHDGYEISRAQKDVRTTAKSAADAAAHAIACSPLSPSGQCLAQPGTSPAARTKAGSSAATREAAINGDVVTAYNYDPVANKVALTIGANADTWILGHLHRAWTDSIKASSTASPPIAVAPK
jgi:hypothetical protein